MDYETTVECYCELYQSGHYKEEAIELLIDEMMDSPILTDSDKSKVLDALRVMRELSSFGNSPQVEIVWSILSQYDGFQTAWAKILPGILQGER